MLPNVMEMCTCTVRTEPLREPEEGGVPRVTIRPLGAVHISWSVLNLLTLCG